MVMSFESLLSQTFVVSRDSSVLLASTSIVPSLNVTYQPSKNCRVTIKVSGGTVYGQCLITGTDENDAVISDLISFSSADIQQASKIYKTVTGITTSGFTGGNIQVDGVLRSGEPLMVRRGVKSSINGRVYRPDSSHSMGIPGEQQVDQWRIMLRTTESDLLKGDFLTESGGDIYQLASKVQPMWGATSLHHYEADVERIES